MRSSQGARERSADKGRGGKGKGETTVAHAHTRSIGNEDVQDDIDRDISNSVQNVASSVTVGVVASSKNDNTEDIDAREDDETFSTSP